MNALKHSDQHTPAGRPLFFLILSCTGGAGHIRAAEALHRTAATSGLPIRTEHHDVLDFTTKVFKKLYSESYLQMVNRVPELWGYLYEHSERKPYRKKGLLKTFDHLNYKRYLRVLRELKPDAILCTHFLPFISISSELRKNGITAPFFAVTTDFDVHQLWIDPVVTRYFVYHEESAWQLQSKQIPAANIRVSGIPVMPEFRSREPQEAIRAKLGLKHDRFTVLVLSGGFGMGRVAEIVEHTGAVLGATRDRDFNLVIVCGKNEKVRSEIRALRFSENVDPHIHGFVTNIHELMDASDILISKAGGLTSSEAMAKSLPMLIVDPIPGQESRNADLLVEHGAGWKAINLANLSYKLMKVLENPSLLVRAREAAAALARPHAAGHILADVYAHFSGQTAHLD